MKDLESFSRDSWLPIPNPPLFFSTNNISAVVTCLALGEEILNILSKQLSTGSPQRGPFCIKTNAQEGMVSLFLVVIGSAVDVQHYCSHPAL